MKQAITNEQWNELDDKQQLKLRKLTKSGKYGWLELSIGEMIEFLGDDFYMIERLNGKYWGVSINYFDDKGGRYAFVKEGLCDALWEACKHKLTNSK